MADFITRLARRVLGTQPVVQPLVAPMFAPEPTSHSNHSLDLDSHSNRSLDLEWDSEATTSPGDLDLRQAPSAEEKLLASSDAPPGRPEDTAMAQQGDQRNLPRAAPRAAPRPSQGTSDLQLEPPHPVEPASTEPRIPEDTAMAQQGDQRNLPPATPERPQRAPDGGGVLHPPGSGPTRREEGVSTSPRVLPKDLPSGLPPGPPVAEGASGQAMPRLVETRAEQDLGSSIAPRFSPNTQASPDTRGSVSGPGPTLDRSAPPDVPAATPRMVHPQPHTQAERGPQEEPRVAAPAAPEPPAPTIQVAIGRIEVRAVTPPPARRETPTRPTPALSLDDYLRQRNGGQR